MNRETVKGFSLVELLIVCVVAGVIAIIAIPYLQKAIRAAENGSTFAVLRTISSTQASFYSLNSRFGNLTEINNILSSGIGSQVGNDLHRGRYVFSMTPAAPTPAELRDGFVITATRDISGDGIVFQYELTQTGEIRQILPAPTVP